ncbi:MAG: RIP metalloprotease RseP [Patescibacteria group bacterium]
MTIIIFLIILGVLVFVHELGHFLFAKGAGVRVDEFGFGYPPRALKLGKKWGTLFSLNWIPFGGFVKIFGENYDEEEDESFPSPQDQKSTDIFLLKNSSCSAQSASQGISDSRGSKNLPFTKVSKKWQASILFAGIFFNILFAWFLFSVGFLIGVPSPVDNDFGAEVKNPILTVVGLVPEFPAQKAGLKTGDKVLNISLNNGKVLQNPTSENVSDFINQSSGQINVQIDRGAKILDFKITPETNTTSNKKIIGIEMDTIGTLKLPIHKAIYEGGRTTIRLSYLTVESIAGLIKGVLTGKANISEVTGPVGIVGLVGDASRLGFSYLLTFTALISINLAVVNLVPFPALDGGRILFVAIEGITRRKINPKVANTLNTVGFTLLIIVMLIVTYRDILKLF